ncbi:hypothetical protein GCM10010531_14240 [Blastococcus jejuensis]|uniref:Polyketide cyclase / dehydrase and lipid transport n=1 Tax=Blastococcus jejuensis TaxID=351224 RepID=A0ABP6P0H7_9ACTN
MIELGKAGTAGTEKGTVPVLDDGRLVATLHASKWKEAATATVGDRAWVFTRQKRQLTGRWASDPETAVRLSARQTSAWKSIWSFDLEGTPVEARYASRWKSTHRFESEGSPVALSGKTGGWSPRPTLTFQRDLPLEHQVFLLWWELLMRRRAASVAAATAAGGGAAS